MLDIQAHWPHGTVRFPRLITDKQTMHLHILGICGTFMGSLALLARQLGHQVTGSDTGIYPPMSDQLHAQGITCLEGYQAAHLRAAAPDLVIIGNALSRGNPAVEYVLNQRVPYLSGPQWLAEQVLQDRWVLAVAGTHGKTTTASLLAWILEDAGLKPGFLIGGVPINFGVSAQLGEAPFFVVEADEYDTAFFDKRSKFLHYQARTLILNNLEYDHADIFPDLAAIQRQFAHLLRTVPSEGLLVRNAQAPAFDAVLAAGCWTPVERFNHPEGWQIRTASPDGRRFEVWFGNQRQGEVEWSQLGRHNQSNALAAIAAARHAGVPPALACVALSRFQGVKRRQELRGTVRGISVYDDFAHHPTAIAETLDALRRRVGAQRIIAVVEPRSNTMKLGVHKDTLAASLSAADLALVHQPPGQGWQLTGGQNIRVFDDTERLLAALLSLVQPGDQVLMMSNGSFENLHARLLTALALDETP